MPKRDVAPIGAPCWVDLLTSDQEKAKAFYSELFDWTIDDPGPDYGGYINFQKDGLPVGGCMTNSADSPTPDMWTIYLATDDIKATVDAAVSHGGQVMLPPQEVMALGTMAVVGDAGGAGIGVWQPGEFKGFGIHAEPNTPAWFELHTRDYDATVQFYRDVFKWKTHVAGDSPEFRYTTLGEGDDQEAGIMDASAFLPEGVPANWSVYFAVSDTDKTVARALELGATLVQPAEDTPYGRLATLADPTGATFKLVG
jgi:predicted enzyme related to lactoylglutathione lyase